MDKKRLSSILQKAPSQAVQDLAYRCATGYPLQIIREPQKTLVMVRMRETVAKAEFYLCEVLACEAMVEVGSSKGFALFAGDDIPKVRAAAILDALLNGQFAQREEILDALTAMERIQQEQADTLLRAHARSRVQFQTMDTDQP